MDDGRWAMGTGLQAPPPELPVQMRHPLALRVLRLSHERGPDGNVALRRRQQVLQHSLDRLTRRGCDDRRLVHRTAIGRAPLDEHDAPITQAVSRRPRAPHIDRDEAVIREITLIYTLN